MIKLTLTETEARVMYYLISLYLMGELTPKQTETVDTLAGNEGTHINLKLMEALGV